MKKNILLIGVGGTGSSAVDIFYQKKQELGNQTDNNITALVFDTDAGDLKKITAAKTVEMADNASVGTICDRLGKEFLKEWFPCDDKAVRSQEMMKGASQWRKKSYLAFLNLMNDQLKRNTFISALESMSADPGAICEVYVISSVAGGTGSGSFIPIALYAKRYLRKALGKDPIVNAMIALPDIYADSQTPENRIKVYSNAYAILRELNAINLVSRNYNAGATEHKKAPIRFRIGDPKEPNVGLLFDASDKQFWTPEAAPFAQVFLLDRIPGLNTVPAHNMVLANSLYTILCTEIGAAFDSELSNHELLRSQNNGSNAIYAGISTSQIRFPKESVLDYLAHKKTLDACDAEWLILHNAVENAIKEKEQQAKANNRRYNMKDGEYADIVIDQLHGLEEKNNDSILSLMERSVYIYDNDGRRTNETAASRFAKKIEKYIGDKIPAPTDDVEAHKNVSSNKLKKDDAPDVVKHATDAYDSLLEYYIACVDALKSGSRSVADSIISLDKKKKDFINKDVSVVDTLLMKSAAGQQPTYLHPVAAMVQLCLFRQKLTDELNKLRGSFEEWDDIKKRNIEELPASVTLITGGGSTNKKSWYSKQGEDRFDRMASGELETTYLSEGDEKIKTDYTVDYNCISADVEAIATKINDEAQCQMKSMVYTSIARDVDMLISKYRSFFKRFEKEKEDLVELTKTAYRKDAGTVDSVINVFSSKEDKDYIYNTVIRDAGPGTDADVEATDDIVGKGVFATVYNSAAAEYAQDSNYNDKDSGAYRSLFGSMVKAYREFIGKSEEFEKIASYNAVEAIVATCKDKKNDDKAISEAFAQAFKTAQEFATPSLRLDATEGTKDLVNHSKITVFMMSENTGRYLKMHAEELGLNIPADQNKESNVIRVCASEFIRRYSGNNSARVTIVDKMPDQVLYCTGEIMDITPLRISKCNELGNDNVYFKNYTTAVANIRKYDTDMWNPHIGNNLHKRGCLPYMNELKEKECDVMAVKALLYGFQKEYIVYKSGVGDGSKNCYFYCNNKKIKDSEGRWVNNKSVSSLMNWIRNQDDLVEDWSDAFDKDIRRQMNDLPSIAGDGSSEISKLESKITTSEYMKLLNTQLYVDPTNAGGKGPSALAFAYEIKRSEELGRDCDDAERVLEVLYSTFKQIVEHRANPEMYPERFIQVYNQQLGNVFEALASAKSIQSSGSDAKDRLISVTQWINQSGAFRAISKSTPMDDKGNICIDSPYEFDDAAKSAETKKSAKEETETAEATETATEA